MYLMNLIRITELQEDVLSFSCDPILAVFTHLFAVLIV